MCISPNRLITGIEVGCRKCWQCRANRINDWVGRCIAESKDALATFSVTLTYGPDASGNKKHERTAVLTYTDVQKYFKRLRFAGHKVRYLISGEYGTLKGRVHWHLMLFWYSEPPTVVYDKRVDDEYWHHGFVWWEKPSVKSIRYVCKYILKDEAGEAGQSLSGYSKSPPLGYEYFMRLARAHVADGLPPRTLKYRFPEAKKKNGKPHEFMLRGAVAEKFLQEYVDEWQRKRPSEWMNTSELVEAYVDPARSDFARDTDLWREPVDLEANNQEREEPDRKKYRQAHEDYYFGKNRIGFFDPEWIPDGEKEKEPEDLEYIYEGIEIPPDQCDREALDTIYGLGAKPYPQAQANGLGAATT